jgi:hypothetical protein
VLQGVASGENTKENGRGGASNRAQPLIGPGQFLTVSDPSERRAAVRCLRVRPRFDRGHALCPRAVALWRMRSVG